MNVIDQCAVVPLRGACLIHAFDEARRAALRTPLLMNVVDHLAEWPGSGRRSLTHGGVAA
jgi:hypothetical protein